ncbi:hypothetical protein KYK29_05365 [Shinella daejeonensis]|uniref:hypothetical protein n=1 Tax=Shinella daejeonensis TaxID=659017 RepID=UPI0020C7F3D5|nr:hypothetical protein [Shinella daejeonensis]MCP8894351.1 hypothetical protein [Shinella daejeonensis]
MERLAAAPERSFQDAFGPMQIKRDGAGRPSVFRQLPIDIDDGAQQALARQRAIIAGRAAGVVFRHHVTSSSRPPS